MTKTVTTRFAPSPTGYLHIGGARTALFNWLYARANDGRMLLRIEDTDRQRSSDEAVDAIIEGLDWLGLQPDGEPVSQFARAGRHREIAEALVEAGHAYRCYASPDELQTMRDEAKAAGKPPRYDGRWRERGEADAPSGIDPVIRIKAPRDGHTIVDDQVQGPVRFPNADLDDFVLLRSDGTPTYMLAVVVDDYDMEVTHIIRGDDHLTNAARQTLIYNAMDWPVPVMAHIPLIHGADGKKLSKRHGALGVDAYRAMGYLPEALRNYLARLGWSHGDDEIMSTEQLIEWFDLSGINQGAARFDFDKLEALNGHYMRHTEDDVLTEALIDTLPHLPSGKPLAAVDPDKRRDVLQAAMPGLKERAKTLDELAASAAFFFASRPLAMDDKAEKILRDGGRQALAALLPELQNAQGWTAESVESIVRRHGEEHDMKLGKLAQPLRAALTGTSTSPGIFEVLEVLGKDEALARIEDQARG